MGVELVTLSRYVADRQAPKPGESVIPIGSAGPGNIQRLDEPGLMERPPLPGNPPGMADHAPSQEVVAGAGPAG